MVVLHYLLFLGPKSGCGGMINLTDTGSTRLTSPGGTGVSSPTGGYGRMLNCEWYILAPREKTIKLNITKFVLENRNRAGKCFDYLEVQ